MPRPRKKPRERAVKRPEKPTRKSGGGRKQEYITNPFVIWDKDEDGNNIVVDNVLRDRVEQDIRIEDIVVGCVRSFSADRNSSDYIRLQEPVSWQKIMRVYKNIDVITVKRVEGYLRCSKSHAARYTTVIKFCNKFITRWQKQHAKGEGSMIEGYQRINKAQLEYL